MKNVAYAYIDTNTMTFDMNFSSNINKAVGEEEEKISRQS